MAAKDPISRKDLWESMESVTQKDWINACERLGLDVSVSGGKGSHAVIRNPSKKGVGKENLIATIQKGLYKLANQKVFKHLREYGFDEDDIWKALKKLK